MWDPLDVELEAIVQSSGFILSYPYIIFITFMWSQLCIFVMDDVTLRELYSELQVQYFKMMFWVVPVYI